MKQVTSENDKDDVQYIFDLAYINIIFDGFLKKMVEKIKEKTSQSDKIIEEGEKLFMKLMEDRRDRNKAIAKTIKIDLEKSNNIEIILDYLKNKLLPSIYNSFEKNNKILFNKNIFNILLKIMLESFNYFIIIIKKGLKDIEKLQTLNSEYLKMSKEFESGVKAKKIKEPKTKDIIMDRRKEIAEFEESIKLNYISIGDKKEKEIEGLKTYVKNLENKYIEDENFIFMLLKDEENKQQVFNDYEITVKKNNDEIKSLKLKIETQTQDIRKLEKAVLSERNQRSKDNYKLSKNIEELNLKINSLNKEKQNYTKEIISVNEQVSSLVKKNNSLNEKISLLIEEKEKNNQALNLLKDSNEKLQENYAYLSREFENIKKLNCDLKLSVDEKNANIDSLEKDYLTFQFDIEKKNSIIQNLNSKLEKVEIDNRRMKNEMKTLLNQNKVI